MKNKTLVIAALAFGLLATSGGAFGQTIICAERFVDGTSTNWYQSEGRMVTVAGQNRLAYDPEVIHEPNGTYPIVYFYLSIGGSPTSDSFVGTGEFTFPPQANGVEVQVHYQKSPSGDDWDVGTTTRYAGAQVARCLNMVVPKGSMISFVVRVKVEDWVADGTPINVELCNFTGLFGNTLGEIPEFQLTPNTGPWRMTWWKHPVIQSIRKTGVYQYKITVQSPPHFWGGNWYLEASNEVIPTNWASVSSYLVPLGAGGDFLIRELEVTPGATVNRQFYRLVLGSQ